MGINVYGVDKSNPLDVSGLDEPVYPLKLLFNYAGLSTTQGKITTEKYSRLWSDESPRYVLLDGRRKEGSIIFELDENSPLKKGYACDNEHHITPIGVLGIEGRKWVLYSDIIKALKLDPNKEYERLNLHDRVTFHDDDGQIGELMTNIYNKEGSTFKILGLSDPSDPQKVRVRAQGKADSVEMDVSVFDLKEIKDNNKDDGT